MKRVLLTILTLALACSVMLAYDFEQDGIYYNILNDSEVAVTGENEYDENEYDYGPGSYSGDVIIPETVNFEGRTYNVTSIANYAFRASDNLISVEIPNTVTSIGEEAFNGCTNLKYVNIPAGVTVLNRRVFWCCFSLEYIEIPYGVTFIGQEALADCNSLTFIEIPRSVITIDEGAFHTCYALTEVSIGNSVETIGNSAFMGCPSLESIYIPFSVKTIGSSAFAYCTNLANIEISSSVNYIGQGAFEYTMWYDNQPDGLVYAGSVAYQYKGEMPENTHITLNEGTRCITANAFYGQNNLISIVMPSSVKNIGDYAFYECPNMDAIICKATTPPDALFSYAYIVPQFVYRVTLFVPESSLEAYSADEEWGKFDRMMPYQGSGPIALNDIYYTIIGANKVAVASINRGYSGEVNIPKTINSGNVTYAVTAIGANAFSARTGLTGVNLNTSITSIGDWAFSSCTGLTHMTIPNSVTSIGERAFGWCSGLQSIDIPNSIESIGENAFYSCENLTDVTLPNSLTRIENGTFSNCKSLASIVIPDGVTYIGDDAFAWCYGLTSVIIPNSVTSLGLRAFYYCTHLTSIEIPNSVTSLGNVVFSGCSLLTSITMKAVTPPQVSKVFSDNNASEYYERVTLYVPNESLESYRSHDVWGKFTHILPFIGAGPGDINGDGIIAVNDVTGLIDQLLNGEELPAYADVNGDGVINIKDITALIDQLLGGQ